MEDKGLFTGIIVLVVALIFGLALLPGIANTSHQVSSKIAVVNDSVSTAPSAVTAAGQINTTISYNISDTQYNDWRSKATDYCPLTSYSLTNSSGTAYVETTDYVFNATYGNFTLKNTANVNASVLSDNKTYVSYTHCTTGYATDSASRSIVVLIPTLLIIALITAVLVYLKRNTDVFD